MPEHLPSDPLHDSPMEPRAREELPSPALFHFYCDESCHLLLPSDGRSEDGARQVMALGGVWCPAHRVRPLRDALRDLKQKHGLSRTFEAKWTKVSSGQLGFYRDWLDLFFDTSDLHFRACVVADKAAFVEQNQRRHPDKKDDFYYYSFCFDVLKVVLDPACAYNIFLDAKDTRGRFKIAELRETLRGNDFYEVPPHVIGRLQEIRSFESELMQLADVLLGILTYIHRDLGSAPHASPAKTQLVEHLRQKSGYSLLKSTLPAEQKVNLWVWHGSHRPYDQKRGKTGEQEI